MYKKFKELGKHGLIAVVVSSSVQANEQIDFFDLSIEQLLQVKTDVASIFPASKLEAPSSVTYFSKQEIQALGVSDLYQLLNYVPGFQAVQGEFISSHQKLQSRGVYLDSGYVLILKDGIRINDVSFGKAGVYTPYIDLSNIEKVEVIRGPGSEIYGSNAFLGVVNLISEKSNKIEFATGNNGLKRLSASLQKQTETGSYSANLAMLETDGQAFSNWQEEGLETTNPNKFFELQLAWQYHGLKAQYKIDRHDKQGFVNLKGIHPDNFFESENQYLALNYNKLWSNGVELVFASNYGEHEIKSAGLITKGSIAPFSYDFLQGPYWKTTNTHVNAGLRYHFGKQLDFQAGVEFNDADHVRAGVVTTHITPDLNSTSPLDVYYLGKPTTYSNLGEFESLLSCVKSAAVYGLAKWSIDDKRTLNLGGRYEKYENENTVFSPRISYLHQLNDTSQVKVIYSKAYRAPVTNELYSNDAVTLGDPNLKPEYISTLEAQYLLHKQDWQLEVTGFYNSMKDLITSQMIENSERTKFTNSGDEQVYGIESLGYYQLNKNIKLRASGTYYLSDTISHAYEHFATLAVMSQFDKFKLSVNGIYRPAVSVSDNNDTSDTSYNFQQDAHVLLNLNSTYQLGRSIEFNVAVNNVFDKQAFAYEPRQFVNQYQVPQMGREVQASIKYKF